MKIQLFRNLFGETVTGVVTTQPYYQLYGEVRVETVPGSGTYVKTLGYVMDPAVDLQARFVLNSGFKGFFLAPHFNPYSVTAITKTTHNVLRGKFFKSQIYGDPPVIQGTPTEVESYLVLKGGIAQRVGLAAGWERVTTDKKFLTWHPVVKAVGIFQPELLHFLIQTDTVTTVNLKVKLTYTDGTDTTVTPRTLAGITQYDLLRIPAGIPNLELASVDFARTISYYELWLEDQAGTVISERRYFELDQYEQRWERLWLYENSFGMPEVFRTVGKTKYGTGITPMRSKLSVAETYDVKQPQYLTRETYLRTDQEISTGMLRDRETAAYMLDFLSQKAPLFELKDGDYHPVQLLPPSVHEEAVDEEYSYFVRFKVAGAFEETVFTPLP